jgi:hypothetical protein
VLDGLPITREAVARTVRLVSTARLRESVLKSLVADDAELRVLEEIEGATSTRLLAQDRGFASLAANEFVFGVPNAAFINASFAYAKPQELNRFNGPHRGAWYAALATETSVREVIFHMTEFLMRTGDLHASVEYAEMFASLAGEYVDLRQRPDHLSLHPDPSVGYPVGNAAAQAALAEGLNGIVYPSVRHAGGTCFVALRPQAVQSVAAGEVVRIVWDGNPEPTIIRLAKT